MSDETLIQALQGTAAPLVYLLAAVAFFLGLKAAVKVRVAGRAALLLGGGVVLALLGAGLEDLPAFLRERSLPVDLLAYLLVGAAVGVLLGQRGTATPPAARVAFVPALAGAAASLAAAGAFTLPGGDLGAEAVALVSAMALGAVALVLGLVVALRGSPSVSSTAAAGTSALLAGWATALLGCALGNVILIVAGGVGGTAALTFARIAARSAGRSLVQVLLRGKEADESGYRNVRSCGTDEAAMVLETAGEVLVVPGFGMPAAHAQHAVKELVEQLEKRGARVAYVLHPAAGCLPGHINIALDEANVSHDNLVDLEAARARVASADAVLVVGANDTINAEAAADPSGALYGLDALDLSRARSVFVVKRSLRPGAGGVRNPQFERPNTMMMFGDGKRVLQALVAELKGGGAH
jgi:NAD(P) transhydrogenase subunit beta